MISAPTGGRPKVIGSSIAIVATGADARQHADQRADQRAEQAEPDIVGVRGDREAEREIVEEDRIMVAVLRHECRPKLERQLQQIDEQHDAECRHHRRRDQAFDPAHLARAEDRDQEGREGGGHEAERRHDDALHHGREGDDGREHEGRTAQREFLDRRTVGQEPGRHDDAADHAEQAREQPRRGARTEGDALHAAEVTRRPERNDRQRDQRQAAPEVARRSNLSVN